MNGIVEKGFRLRRPRSTKNFPGEGTGIVAKTFESGSSKKQADSADSVEQLFLLLETGPFGMGATSAALYDVYLGYFSLSVSGGFIGLRRRYLRSNQYEIVACFCWARQHFSQVDYCKNGPTVEESSGGQLRS
ncbi:hypothetical protein Tcan_10313 [Toxocara canis]|uniref:Uncharacterized protein n=2 Tax=Toxocara canis TaxID=6265 RepID=A0A0B2VTT4_TOXCA|nr:hypothetical protein Tcan_10313 [Toxocara canis]VDM25822.1 unnamed protein product [Toxocara canis]